MCRQAVGSLNEAYELATYRIRSAADDKTTQVFNDEGDDDPVPQAWPMLLQQLSATGKDVGTCGLFVAGSGLVRTLEASTQQDRGLHSMMTLFYCSLGL
jgi:hypothetical protein